MDRAQRASMIALVVVMTASACGGQEPAPAPEASALDPAVPYTTQWSAPPNVDLFDRTAELVRASVEAGDYAMTFGVDGDVEGYPTFPGYVEAIGAPPRGDANFTGYYYAEALPQAETGDRALYYDLTEVTVDGNTIDATVCGYELGDDPAQNASLMPLKDAVHVRLSNPTGSAGIPGTADTDPYAPDPRAHVLPSWNVFGDWKIDSLIHARYDEQETFSEVCFSWWAQQFPTFAPEADLRYLFPPEGYVFPTVPAEHLQYPEWIGPADPS